jgi:hypothetical protein
MLEEIIAVSNAGNSEQFDTDILQCKADILRSRNIIPLHENSTQKNPATQDSTRETAPLPRPAVSVNKKEEAETLQAPKRQGKPEIPSFDLAEEIMAEQRKITAIRRKAPGQKTEAQRLKPETPIVDHIIEQPESLLSEQEKIIAEIVARDIERLCRGDYSGE